MITSVSPYFLTGESWKHLHPQSFTIQRLVLDSEAVLTRKSGHLCQHDLTIYARTLLKEDKGVNKYIISFIALGNSWKQVHKKKKSKQLAQEIFYLLGIIQDPHTIVIVNPKLLCYELCSILTCFHLEIPTLSHLSLDNLYKNPPVMCLFYDTSKMIKVGFCFMASGLINLVLIGQQVFW